ncbi:MAG: hypothetical protein Q4G30_00230 [Actinomycetaceae bacterium]|nr:hypothetical protein [Actinomycetaceae bacterium]
MADLLPIHPTCDCSVEPLPDDWRRWESLDGDFRVIDKELLEATHQQVGLIEGVADRSGKDPDYRKLIIVSEHGEIGPELKWRHLDKDKKPKQTSQGKVVSSPQALPRSKASRVDDGIDWLERQNALPVKFNGEILEPHEVRFVERFTSLGNEVEWIQKDRVNIPRKSTNDFIWINHSNEVCEHKTTTAKYGTIALRIRETVEKARKHDVVKDVFVVQIEDHQLGAKVERQLEMYNANNPNNPIRELWVLDSDGLRQIKLRK